MRATTTMAIATAILVLGWQPATGWAQGGMVTNSTPGISAGHSFSENIGTSWGIRKGNFFFNFGGGAGAVPPFGNPQPGAGLQGGVAIRTPGGLRGNFNFNFSQGATSSNVMQGSTLTTTNGYPGFIFSGAQSPFVISTVPVVGQGAFQDFGPANTLRGRLMRGEAHFDSNGRLQIGPRPAVGPQQAMHQAAQGPVPLARPAAAAQGTPARQPVAAAAPRAPADPEVNKPLIIKN